MRFWLIQRAEPVPTDGPSVRLMRTGLLARTLAGRGHDVVWWSSTFDHYRKLHRFKADTLLELEPGLRLHLVHSGGYGRNVSLARMVNDRAVARGFARLSRETMPPDLIVSSLPTVDLCTEAVRLGAERDVPVVIDVRDMWPDIFVGVLPAPLRGPGRVLVAPLVARARFALRSAAGLTAMSRFVFDWALRHAGRPGRAADGVFPLGYQAPVVAPDARERAGDDLRAMGVDPAKTICWFVGQLGRVYDVATVIEGARALWQRGRADVQLVISGDGDNAAALRARARDLPNVVFTGWVNTAQIAWLMAVAGVGLAAVRPVGEALPNKLFEYLSAGLPVLSSLRGEAEGLLARHGCGVTYPPGDVAAFVEAVERLAGDIALRETMGRNATALYAAGYSSEAVYGRMAAHLEAVARQHADGRSAAPGVGPRS